LGHTVFVVLYQVGMETNTVISEFRALVTWNTSTKCKFFYLQQLITILLRFLSLPGHCSLMHASYKHVLS